jgi:hypothetical protein
VRVAKQAIDANVWGIANGLQNVVGFHQCSWRWSRGVGWRSYFDSVVLSIWVEAYVG